MIPPKAQWCTPEQAAQIAHLEERWQVNGLGVTRLVDALARVMELLDTTAQKLQALDARLRVLETRESKNPESS